MAKDKVTLRADGTVSVSDFHVLIGAMAEMLSALTQEATPNPAAVDWVVHTLKAGSATVVSRGLTASSLAEVAVEEVVERYQLVARKAHHGNLDEFPRPVQNAVRKLASLLDGRITRIWLSGGDGDGEWAISRQLADDFQEEGEARPGIDVNTYARTSIKGQVVTLDDKHATYFTLREAHTGRLIRCYPRATYKLDLGNYWAAGSWVIVEGTFSRYTDPPTMYDISDIVALEEAKPGSWRDAIGCAPRRPGDDDVSAADAVRRVRDG